MLCVVDHKWFDHRLSREEISNFFSFCISSTPKLYVGSCTDINNQNKCKIVSFLVV